jgi:sigma-B regulation protein RsbU (phosphoserine phosphatase)
MRRKIELNALLEITQAINSNIPEEDLYRVFYFTCISNLQLSEVALFVFEKNKFIEKFSHDLSFTTKDLELFEKEKFDVEKVKEIHPNISQVFQVKHKDKLLAVLFLGTHNSEEVQESYSFLQTLSNIVLVAIENKRLVRQSLAQERIKKEVEIARNVQEMLIPNKLPNNHIIQSAATYLPHQMIGGDYFDLISIGDNYVFCIADVSGKGVPAALIMSNFQASLRSLCKVTTDVDTIIRDLNTHLIENARSDHFVTCFLAFYDSKSKILQYVNAGHNPPFLLQGDEDLLLGDGCYMLGVFDKMPENIKMEIDVKSGDKLFMYTDGVTETSDNDGEEFGEFRLLEFLKATKKDDLQMNIADLIIAVDSFKQDQDYRDDLTMLSIRFI